MIVQHIERRRKYCVSISKKQSNFFKQRPESKVYGNDVLGREEFLVANLSCHKRRLCTNIGKFEELDYGQLGQRLRTRCYLQPVKFFRTPSDALAMPMNPQRNLENLTWLENHAVNVPGTRRCWLGNE